MCFSVRVCPFSESLIKYLQKTGAPKGPRLRLRLITPGANARSKKSDVSFDNAAHDALYVKALAVGHDGGVFFILGF